VWINVRSAGGTYAEILGQFKRLYHEIIHCTELSGFPTSFRCHVWFGCTSVSRFFWTRTSHVERLVRNPAPLCLRSGAQLVLRPGGGCLQEASSDKANARLKILCYCFRLQEDGWPCSCVRTSLNYSCVCLICVLQIYFQWPSVYRAYIQFVNLKP
jgi:hypothetical protein